MSPTLGMMPDMVADPSAELAKLEFLDMDPKLDTMKVACNLTRKILNNLKTLYIFKDTCSCQ